MRRLGLLLIVLFLIAVVLWKAPQSADSPEKSSPVATPELEPATALEVDVESRVQPQRAPLAPKLSVEPPEEEEVYEEADELDPLEMGSSTLELRFFDAETLSPVSGTVQLWRMNAPATRHWEAGDQMQVLASLVDGILIATDLPEGEYRSFALFGRPNSQMQASFQVEGKYTLMERFVYLPKKEEAQLQLVDLDGFLIESNPSYQFEMRHRGKQYIHTDPQTPPWMKQRWPKGNGMLISTGTGGGFMSGNQPWENPFKHGNEIQLGFLAGDTREQKTQYRFQFRTDKKPCTEVVLGLKGTGTYVAIFVDETDLHSRVIFPTGAMPVELADAMWVTSTAIPIASGFSTLDARRTYAANTWRDATLNIRINLDGYQTFDFTWSPNDGPLPEFYLQRLPDDAE